jgi:hypothetical protein
MTWAGAFAPALLVPAARYILPHIVILNAYEGSNAAMLYAPTVRDMSTTLMLM